MNRFSVGFVAGIVSLLAWLAWDLRPREYRHPSRPTHRGL